MSQRETLALHESAHASAAFLLGRPVGAIRIDEHGGGAEVGTLRPDDSPSPEQALDELAVLLIGRVVARGLPAQRQMPGDDEHRARELALRACDHNADEAAALLEFGRARARTIAGRPDFIAAAEGLARALAAEGELSASEVEAELSGGRHAEAA